MGPYGLTRGPNDINDPDDPFLQIAEIHIWSGSYIDSIQLFYQDTRLPPGSPLVPGERHGGDGGVDEYIIQVHPGEWIIGIQGTYGDYLNTLAIMLNTRMDPIYRFAGGESGPGPNPLHLAVSDAEDQEVFGFVGSAGAYINQLGIKFRDRT